MHHRRSSRTVYSVGMDTTAAPPIERPHPAKYGDDVLAAIREHLRRDAGIGGLVVDPFAGTGRIHQLRPEWVTYGVELELEWAAQGFPHTVCGDARQASSLLGEYIGPAAATGWDAVVTSPCYGNRMADTYDGSRDTCTTCGGDGTEPGHPEGPEDAGYRPVKCARCAGTGYRSSRRHTYTIDLGRPVTPGNAAAMQWGAEYRQLHRQVWEHCVAHLRPGGVFILNISDHVRAGALQGVDLWHSATLGGLGLDLVRATPVYTRRQRLGANGEARAACEWVLSFRKAARL
jgi:hypothetical protein